MEKIFIGWNGINNREIAYSLEKKLRHVGYGVIIGGQMEEDKSTVSETIIAQMNRCDFAIVIIEGIWVTEEKVNSCRLRLSENVMFEIGYLCSKFNNKRRVKLFLLGFDPGQLPSDILGAWAERLDKRPCADEDDRQKMNDELANAMFEDTVEELEQLDFGTDKFEYLAKWENNKAQIYNYNGIGDISNCLLFGLQTAIYNGETKQLYNALKNISLTNVPEHITATVNCVKSLLAVFVITGQLVLLPTKNELRDAMDNLRSPYEDKITQPDLKAWCRILRNDKLELCYELASKIYPERELRYLHSAIETSDKVIKLIQKQIDDNPNDRNFAQLYLSYQYRNMALLLRTLREKEPEKYTAEEEHYYRSLAVDTRRELRQFYGGKYSQDDIFYDCLMQEYILALSELYPFMEDELEREDTIDDITEKLSSWKAKIDCKNFIFKKIEDVVENLKIGDNE